MDWNKYFKEKDAFKRYAMLEKDNRLSYDHIDNWLFSLKFFLSKTQANPEDLSANKDFTAQSVSPKPCPQCEGNGRIYVYPDDNADATICYKCEGTGKAS